MTEYIEATVAEDGVIETDGVIEGKVKPEQVGTGVPGYEAKTVYPESGCVFSRFEMAGFPEPTAEETITENGTHHVERVGVVKVEVPVGVFPTGTLPITANGTYDVSGYAEAEVNVNTDPEIGIVFDDFMSNGLPQTVRTVGMTELPSWCFYVDNRYNRTLLLSQIRTLIINEGVTTLPDSCARGLKTMTRVVLPSTLQEIQANAFLDDGAVAEYDFSACAAVPTLATAATLAHAAGCAMKVPAALLEEWQAEAVWRDMADVVWQGV